MGSKVKTNKKQASALKAKQNLAIIDHVKVTNIDSDEQSKLRVESSRPLASLDTAVAADAFSKLVSSRGFDMNSFANAAIKGSAFKQVVKKEAIVPKVLSPLIIKGTKIVITQPTVLAKKVVNVVECEPVKVQQNRHVINF